MNKFFKLLFVLTLLISVSANLNAQKSSLRKALLERADKLYELKAYADAIPKYEQVLEKDSTQDYVVFNLADCYRLTNNSKEALVHYSIALQRSTSLPIHKYYYAQALMQNGDFTTAEKYMKEYVLDDRGKTFTKAITNLSDFYKDTASNKVKFATFNSRENDFSPVILDSQVVFVSSRVRAQAINYIHTWTDEKYYFLYYTQLNDKGEYIKPKLFQKDIQTRFNDGPVCFTKDNKTIYFTRNNLRDNKAIKASNGNVNLNLYSATFNETEKIFDNIQSLPFNSRQYHTAHPALNPDGSKLYFSSDMPGGFGGMDIWVVDWLGTKWGKPVNMGNKVNTSGNEIFPYVLDDKTMFFSSNGLEGIGGLDIFMLGLNDEGLPAGTPKNMGANINSPADDFGITFFPGGTKGFLSSNRKNYNLNDDIYEFALLEKPQIKMFQYIISVLDSTTRQPLEAKVDITDNQSGEKIDVKVKDGAYIIKLFPEQKLTVSANFPGYYPKNNLGYAPPADTTQPFEILLNPVAKYFIAGTVTESADGQPKTALDSAIVVVTDTINKMVCGTFYTDISGKYQSCELLPNIPYVVNVSKKGYYSKSEIVPSVSPGGTIIDFDISKFVVGKTIVINNIYFDFDKYDIRMDASKELDRIVKFLNENPEIIIELSSHTDCRGTAKYNKTLSRKRAIASAAYIVSKGIDKGRIKGKGYGESQPVISCDCRKSGKSKCSAAEHQMNRRTEFKITGFVKGIGNVNLDSGKNSQ